LLGLSQTLIIPNKLFPHAHRLPQKISRSQLLSTKAANILILSHLSDAKVGLRPLLPFSLQAQEKQMLKLQYQREELAAGLQVTWCCKIVADISRATDHYFGKKELQLLCKIQTF